jgi:subtilase family serine protease
MRIGQFVSPRALISAAVLALLCAANSAAQIAPVPSRITQRVSDSSRVVLRGNVYPLARPEFDRGIAPASLPMEHIMLLLKRSPQQEAALEALLAQQQNRSSSNYHRWLTPAQFGAEFGPSDQDMETVENWLESHGFTIDRVSTGRTVIEFSGSAGEVQSAFQTEIHRYVLPNGAQHWANSADPSIPTALAPVIAGIRSLNDFYPRPLSHVVSVPRAARPRSQSTRQPAYTFAATGPCSYIQSLSGGAPSGDICFMVTPADFGVIYNVQPLWSGSITGTGETIAIANDSNINVSDVSSFRSLMGLPAKNPQVILANGTDPGVTGDESEAVLDAEWSGAIAPAATIDLVIAPSTNSTFGGDTAAEYVIDNNLAPILSYSFGAPENCSAGGVGNFYGPLWQQAAAEGMTVLVASGDNGSAACDTVPSTPNTPGPATHGIQVNGLASPPDDVAVGGTDFNDVSNPGSYWNTSNSTSATQAAAKGYIPETSWNESCTNAVFSTSPLNANFGNVTTAEGACNNATLEMPGTNLTSFVVPSGGSGGVSSIYPKPAWQSGITPADGQRDLPDVSLFAGTGAISASFYYLCQSDLSNPPQTCSLSGAIDGVGGTSVSVQAMAGIVALIDQKAGGPQGNINPALYGLFGSNNCPSSAPTSTCTFYDVTQGTITMPCQALPAPATPNCVAKSGDTYGILEDGTTPAYNAGTGYDLATGLGSINAANLANAPVWAPASTAADFSLSSSNPTVSLGSSGKGTMQITITPQNGFSGPVNLSCPGLPAGDACSFNPASPVTVSGATNVTLTVTGTIASVPGRIIAPVEPGDWPLRAEVLFAFGCLAASLLVGIRIRRHRWNPVVAVLALVLFAVAGCSGGGSSMPSGNNGGGGSTGAPFMTTLTATTCSANAGPGCAPPGITHSLAFTIQ